MENTIIGSYTELNVRMVYFQTTAQKWKYRRCLRHRLDKERVQTGTASFWAAGGSGHIAELDLTD